MGALRSIYFALDEHLFNSFPRKFLGCILPGWVAAGMLGAILLGVGGPVAGRTRTLVLIVLAVAALASVLGFWAALHAILGPLKQVTQVFETGDFSRDIVLENHDELRGLADAYNAFAKSLRGALSESKNLGLGIAVRSTRTAKLTRDALAKSQEQTSLAEAIFSASLETRSAVHEIAQMTLTISARTSENLDQATSTREELVRLDAIIGATTERIRAFAWAVTELSEKSDRIRKILKLIEGVAQRTNLLALNAHIEAAHAGRAGAGFMVVATEVQKLAEQVKDATGEISEGISGMIGQVQSIRRDIEEINQNMEGTARTIGGTTRLFGSLVADFGEAHAQLQGAASAIEEVSRTNDAVHGRVEGIHALSAEMAHRMEESQSHSSGMNEATEMLLEVVTRFKTGDSELEQALGKAQAWRDRFQARIQQVKDRGVNVFDHDYRPVPNTTPPKFLTTYTEALGREMVELQDAARAELGSIYALATDLNGYIGMHHSEFSKPMTGNPEVDLVNSRHQRLFFNVETEKRRARNTKPFLFQTYMRDTGEILNDLSLPILVDGRHWGAIIVGFKPERFMDA